MNQSLSLRVKGMTREWELMRVWVKSLTSPTIIAQQLQNLLPTILAQVGNHANNPENVANDNTQGNVRNVIVDNARRGCTYKEFLACNPKEYDGKGGAVVYTRWIENVGLRCI